MAIDGKNLLYSLVLINSIPLFHLANTSVLCVNNNYYLLNTYYMPGTLQKKKKVKKKKKPQTLIYLFIQAT